MEFRLPKREQNSNKGTFGKVLNIAGSKNYTGSAYLSSLAAYKIGAGYVALASDRQVLSAVSKMLPEAVFLNREFALQNIKTYSIMLIGCGLGTDEESHVDFMKFMSYDKPENEIPVVIDADGLNILSKHQFIKLPPETVITPHPAEAARLLETDVSEIIKNMNDSAKKLSEKYNCVTVLKSHNTVISDKKGNIYVNKHGNSALAKAGTGDVLAGIIAGLVAQKMPMFEAAKTGVYLHSRAGEIASEELTEYSVLASDVIKYIPAAIKELINQQP